MPFRSADWLYELKHDGYRCMAAIDGGQVRLQTKSGADCTAWLPEVAESLAKLQGPR
jgi:ATP-dependent DNA ligase